MSHTTHFDDCGCLTARYEARIAELEQREREFDKLHAVQVARVEILIGEKATLEAELAASREDARAGWTEQAEMALECYALLATANGLRAALEELACLGNGDVPGNSDGNVIAQRALAANAVPAQSLAAHDAEVLERAAKACEAKVSRPAGHRGQWEGYGGFEDDMTGPECAQFIRALAAPKDSPSKDGSQAATHSVPDGTSEVKP